MGSSGFACKHRREHRVQWGVLVRRANHSAFNGGRRTPSDYSAVLCPPCGTVWRTKAAYVDQLPDHVERPLRMSDAPPPEGFKNYTLIVTPSGEVIQPASCWVVQINALQENDLRSDLRDSDLTLGQVMKRWGGSSLRLPPPDQAESR